MLSETQETFKGNGGAVGTKVRGIIVASLLLAGPSVAQERVSFITGWKWA
jgi:hypothetical protein